MKKVISLVCSILFISCGALRVNYDYDKSTDFTNYSTYNYYSDVETGLSVLDTKRLMKAIDSTMRTKGLLLSEEPDFLIDLHSKSYANPNGNAIGLGVGGGGRNIGGGLSIGIPVSGAKLYREIIFDFIDAQKDKVFWQSAIEGKYRENASPNERESILRAVVEKAFATYPPE